jgi:hypothetical protein
LAEELEGLVAAPLTTIPVEAEAERLAIQLMGVQVETLASAFLVQEAVAAEGAQLTLVRGIQAVEQVCWAPAAEMGPEGLSMPMAAVDLEV